MNETFNNPFKVHQELKPGISQLVSQAWDQYVKDRNLVSTSKHEINEVFQGDWFNEMEECLNETFIATIRLPPDKPMFQEIFTGTQRVTSEAQARGHHVGPALPLETGWDFTKAVDRAAALKWVRKHKPYFLVLAFPCGPWSPLMRLNAAKDLEEKQAIGRILIDFSLELAKEQSAHGRHFLIENPFPSGCWKLPEMVKFLEENMAHVARFDQCRFNLRSANGNLHKTETSSQEMKNALECHRCTRDHIHDPVIGGPAITQRAGHYPLKLSEAMVRAMEKQFEKQFQVKNEVMAVQADDEAGDDDDGPGPMGMKSSGSDEHLPASTESSKVPAAIKMAVKRLHKATGHRSNRRLAMALVISGAPLKLYELPKFIVVQYVQCVGFPNLENRKPASLPVPKDISDQVHVDIFDLMDARELKALCHPRH